MKLALIVIGLPVCAAFVTSVISFAGEKTVPSFAQLVGAGSVTTRMLLFVVSII